MTTVSFLEFPRLSQCAVTSIPIFHSRLHRDAIRQSGRRRVYYGLSLSHVRGPSFCNRFEQLRRKVGVRMTLAYLDLNLF